MTFNRIFCGICWLNVVIAGVVFNWMALSGWFIAAYYITKEYWNQP
jgi:hypothetical protein